MYTNTLESVWLRPALEVTHSTLVHCYIVVKRAKLTTPYAGGGVAVMVSSGLQLFCCHCMGGGRGRGGVER